MRIMMILAVLLAPLLATAQLPQVSAGSIRRLEGFPSRYVNPRNVDVWLPEGYTPTRKYPVLYMHDGQMLYDSTYNWNKQEWKVDETVTRLVREQKIPPCIVVGIWNNGLLRHSEYFPEKTLPFIRPTLRDSLLTQLLQQEGRSDEYLAFIVKELKPFIDSAFSTYPDREHTFIAGSSMGGIISLYAICEYPRVFGGAACLSTHWPGIFDRNDAIPDAYNRYLQKQLPSARKHRIYFDYGSETLDNLYEPYQKKVDELMRQKGYSDKNWITRYFPGENHSERAWSKRLDVPLLFLMGEKS